MWERGRGQSEGTRALFQNALPRAHSHAHTRTAEEAFTQGNEEFVKENWQAALEAFSKAADLDPSKSEYHLHKAAAMCKMGAYSQAVAVCDEVMGKEPQNAKAFLRKGMALVSSGELTAAAQVLQQGQALDPSNRSFATWLKKCGDVPAAPAAAASGGTNANLGKHDAELAALLAAHGNQGFALMDTVVEYLSRNTNMMGLSSAPEMLGSLAVKYSTASSKPSDGAAAPAAPPAPALGGMRDMSILVSSSAKKAWEKAVADRTTKLNDESYDPNYIAPGTQCKNNGCSLTYVDASSMEQACTYHPGGPVFHEGYKFWSCCKRKKTTEFSEFMGFPGCTKGTCIFLDDPTKKKKALCRYDFFQQGSTVTLSIYAKKVDPQQCKVALSATRLSLSILFDFINTFALDVNLAGKVDPEGCKVEILAPKVEITLKKADGSSWQELGELLSADE